MKSLTAPLTARQCDGLDCVVCGGGDGAMVPTGDYARVGGLVASFAHESCLAVSRTPAGAGPPSVSEGSSGRPDYVCVACTLDDHAECSRFVDLDGTERGCTCDHGQRCSTCGKPGQDKVGLSIAAPGPDSLPEELGFCSIACMVRYVKRRWIDRPASVMP